MVVSVNRNTQTQARRRFTPLPLRVRILLDTVATARMAVNRSGLPLPFSVLDAKSRQAQTLPAARQLEDVANAVAFFAAERSGFSPATFCPSPAVIAA